MKIYTRTGDAGETGLIGGARVPKDNQRIEAIGEVDELNAMIGLVLSHKPDKRTNDLLETIQHTLFNLGADLASPADAKASGKTPRIVPADYELLEREIDEMEKSLPKLTAFILPGGTETGATFHLARAVCRRAERAVVATSKREQINQHALVYLNRLSDYLFVLSRYVNISAGMEETKWEQPK